MKVGRNAPCPCGSGKKYKKCCMLRKVTTPDELDYRRLREVHDRLFDNLAQHAERVFGQAAMQVALREYWLWPEEEEEAEAGAERLERHMQLFWPWFVFNWEYDPLAEEIELDGPPERTVAELYARERALKLDSLERKFIEAVNRKPYTFYEVLEVEPGRQILLQDVLSGSQITVHERTASRHVKPSDIVFGRAVIIDDIGMIVGLGSYVMPPRYKPMIIEFRGGMNAEGSTISDEVLNDWDFEIRELYLNIDRLLFTRPKLCNTDGDPLEFHKVVYDMDSTDAAFEKLVSLCVTTKASELRKEAERDADGHIRRAEIIWDRKGHKAGPGLRSTLLGRIVLDGGRLTAELNSARRARTIRKKIEAKLGSGARFRMEEIRGLDGMMNDEELLGRAAERSTEHDALMRDPEVRRQLADVVRKHWESWVDMQLPALGGKTPREAVRNSDGIEAVEALLAEAERHGENDPNMGEMNRDGTRLVRELLGLTKPLPGNK